MSRGGFKAFKVDVQGISGGGSVSDVESVLSSISQGIVDTNQGWSFDTNKTSSSAMFVSFGSQLATGDKRGRAQFLVHTSGAKLCVAMHISGGTENGFDLNSCLNPESGSTSSNDGVLAGGLCMSMIPPNKGDYNIDRISESDFMPNSALRMSGFGMSWSDSYYPKCFVERADMNGKIFRYMIVVRNDIITVAGRRTDISNTLWFYALGNMIKCVRASDLNSYCSLNPIYNYGSLSEGDTTQNSISNIRSSNEPIDYNSYGNCQIYAEDGGLLSAKKVYVDNSTTIGGQSYFKRYVELMESSGSDERRFAPFHVGVTSTNSKDGVVAYDKYKGIVNTECLCQVSHKGTSGSSDLTLGAKLDGGNYYHIGNGILIGWDASNTIDFWN